MSVATMDFVKELLYKHLDSAKELVDAQVWLGARIHAAIACDLIDLVGTIRTDGDPTEGPDDGGIAASGNIVEFPRGATN